MNVADIMSRIQGDHSPEVRTPERENFHVLNYEEDLGGVKYEEPLVFHAILVEMDDDFKTRLEAAHDDDEYWKLVLRTDNRIIKR